LPEGLDLDDDGFFIIYQQSQLSEKWGQIARDLPRPPHFPAQWKRCKCRCEDVDSVYVAKKIKLLAEPQEVSSSSTSSAPHQQFITGVDIARAKRPVRRPAASTPASAAKMLAESSVPAAVSVADQEAEIRGS